MFGKVKETVKLRDAEIVVREDKGYPFAVERVTDGSYGSGNRLERTEVKARKVVDADRDEVQIEIEYSYVKSKSDRLYEHFTGFTLPTRIAKLLADVINEPVLGTCPNCGSQGPIEEGCPSCPGFWFDGRPQDTVEDIKIGDTIEIPEWGAVGQVVGIEVPGYENGLRRVLLQESPDDTKFTKYAINTGEFYILEHEEIGNESTD